VHMQFFKKLKKKAQSALAEETTDAEFDEAEKNYFNVQAGVERLLCNIEQYSQAWDRIVALRNQIAGDFLFFYKLQSTNRDVGDSYMKINRSIFSGAVHNHQTELKGILTKIRAIRQEFINTRDKCKKRQETRTIYDRKRYALQNFTNNKKFDKEEAARKHEKVKRFENEYTDATRDIRTIFSKLEERRDHFIDKPFQEFLLADGKMIESVSPTAADVQELQHTLKERKMQGTEQERLRIMERGDSSRRRVSTWTQNRINKMKQEFHFVTKKEHKHESQEYYFKPSDQPHPLHLTIGDLTDFDYMHELFSPECKKHPRIKELSVKPCKVKTKHLNKRVFTFRGSTSALLTQRTPRRTPRLTSKGSPTSLPVYIARHGFSRPDAGGGPGDSADHFHFLEFHESERLYSSCSPILAEDMIFEVDAWE